MVGWILLCMILLFLAVILIRALRFRPVTEEEHREVRPDFDENAAVDHLQQMIRCKTVSYQDHGLENQKEFEKLRALLPQFYPTVFSTCTVERVDRTGLLFHWKGKRSDSPSVLMAHYDVVPVVESEWEKPPFEGIIEDGVLWGRGTLDTKITFCSSLEAAETLMKSGFVPEQDIYLSYAGDEETGGNGAPSIVSLLKERGIHPGMVVDEGGAVVENVFPGVTGKMALIGIGEKGKLELTLRVRGNGGHASAPLPHGPVGYLAKAVVAVEDHPFPARLSGPVSANLWCFLPVLDMICRKSGGELNAMLRTTCAFTQMQGSAANNVIPPSATVGANLRLIEGDTVASAVEYIRRTVNNADVEVIAEDGDEPSPTSRYDTVGWQRVRKAVEQTWPEAVVSPYLMVQCSDSRHFNRICDNIYKFSAMELTKEERGLIHGNNERIPLEKVGKAVQFYMNLEALC